MGDVPGWITPLHEGCNLPVVLISLADQTQRRSDLIQLGLPKSWVLRYFPAIDLRNAPGKEIELMADLSTLEMSLRRPVRSAEIGCALSHRAAARWLADSEYQLALVLEDDVVPQTADWITQIMATAEALESHARRGSAFVCLLGARREQADRALSRRVICRGGYPPTDIPELYLHCDPVRGLWRAHAYLISHAAALRSTERETRIMTLADDWNERLKLGLIDELFYTRPILVGQDEDRPSTIRPPNHDDYTRRFNDVPFVMRVGRAFCDGSFAARVRALVLFRTTMVLAWMRAQLPYEVRLDDIATP